jgi:hypothetical protein
MKAVTHIHEREPRANKIDRMFRELIDHPFFNWRWSVVDVALIVALVYTFH